MLFLRDIVQPILCSITLGLYMSMSIAMAVRSQGGVQWVPPQQASAAQ